MNLVPDPMGIAEGRAMLGQLPQLYFAVLKSTHIERHVGQRVRCTFELPVLGKRTKTAPTARDAIRAVLFELSDVLTKTPSHKWPEAWHRVGSPGSSDVGTGPAGESEKAERFQSKARQFTIGVTMPVKLKLSLQGIADQQSTSFADIARQMTTIGFEAFDERSFSEGSEGLLSTYMAGVGQWLPSDTEQVMIRLDPSVAVRLRSAAKEYSKSASEFGAMCLAHGLVLQTQLADLGQKVAAVRGSAVRGLAPKVGLGTHAALLSGVLAGSISAPKKVLKRLGEAFEVSEFVLKEYFARFFESRAVPAFKAEYGKPQVPHSATSWEEAVKSLNLPPDQAKELLQLNE